MKKNNVRAYLAAIAYAVIVGFSFLFSKIALENSQSVLNFLAHRFLVSFVFLMGVIFISRQKVSLGLGDFLRLLPLALASPLLFSAAQAYGLQYISSAEGGIILASIPIFTMILASSFLGEKTNSYQKVSIVLSVLGVVYIMWKKGLEGGDNTLRGIVLLLVSALSFSIYSILARKLSKDYSNLELSLVMIGVSFVFFNGLAFFRNIREDSFREFFMVYSNKEFFLAIVYLGVLSSLGTSYLTNYVLARLEASKMVVFSNLGTVISIIAGGVFLGEAIYYYHILGSIMIILGIVGTNYFDKRAFRKRQKNGR